MPSIYLQPEDYVTYGAPSTTTSADVTQASSLIDGYLQRPEGLIWAPDGSGNPCYMVNKTPLYTLASTDSIAPGTNVNVTVATLNPTTAISLGSSQCGLVAILDRGNPAKTEAVVVIAISTGMLQFSNVQFAHDVGCTIEFDMVIYEELVMPDNRPLANVSRTPVRIVLGIQGRYGYSRRGNSPYSQVDQFNLLAAVTQFGGPPVWEIANQNEVGVDPNTGVLWFPSGILLAYYTEVRVGYIAGWQYASLPTQIKTACANLITSKKNIPLNGAIRSYRAGDTAIERFGATYFDEDTKSLLEPFSCRQFV